MADSGDERSRAGSLGTQLATVKVQAFVLDALAKETATGLPVEGRPPRPSRPAVRMDVKRRL